PNRVVALFDDPRLIDQDHAVAITQALGNQLVMALPDGRTVPGTLANEMLQVAHVDPLGQGDPLGGLAGVGPQQALQIDAGPDYLFGAPKRLSKGGLIGRQGIDKLLHVARCQVADGRRARCWYNNGWHRYPPVDLVVS